MVDNDERLIDKDMEEAKAKEAASQADKSALWLAIKISAALGIVASMVTTLILVNSRMNENEAQLSAALAQLTELQARQEKLAEGVNELHKLSTQLQKEVGTLDIGAAKGDLSTTLGILDTQSVNFNKQLAVTRNGLISLARMVKGSRVWQEDYRSQYQVLFDDNKKVKESIDKLRGVAKKEEESDRFIELDF